MKRFAVGDKFEVVGIFSGRPAFHEVVKRTDTEITTLEKWIAEDTWEECKEESTFKIEIDEATDAERIEIWEYHGEHGYVWAQNEEKKEEEKEMKKLDNAMGKFEFDGVTYTMTKTGYCYKTTGKFDKKGQPINMRIAKHVYEERFEEYLQTAQDEADAELEERQEKQDQSDREAEEAVNGKKTKKVRRSKDIAHESNGVTLTAKQVDFIKHLPDTSFWEHGLDSMPWCDVLADEIGGQFAGKPMTVGAMISTLREKHLINVGIERMNGKKAKYLVLTDLGKKVAKELGLN